MFVVFVLHTPCGFEGCSEGATVFRTGVCEKFSRCGARVFKVDRTEKSERGMSALTVVKDLDVVEEHRPDLGARHLLEVILVHFDLERSEETLHRSVVVAVAFA